MSPQINLAAKKPTVVTRIPGGDAGEDVLDDKGDWGKLKVKKFSYRQAQDNTSFSFLEPNYAEGEMDEVTFLELKCAARAFNPIAPYALVSPSPQNYDADAIVEEYIECRWEPSDRFVNDPTTTAKVVVRHAATFIVAASLTGDPESYSQQMGAQGELVLEQFGNQTEVPVYIQVTTQGIEVRKGARTELTGKGSVDLDRSVEGTASGDTSGSGSATVTAKENMKLGGSGQVQREDDIALTFTRNGADPVKKKDQAIITGEDSDDLGHMRTDTKRFTVRANASVGANAAGPENLAESSLTLQGTWECKVEVYQAGQLVAALLPGFTDRVASEAALALAQLRQDIVTLANLGTPLIVAARALGLPDRQSLSAVLAADPLSEYVSKTRTLDEMLGLDPGRTPSDLVVTVGRPGGLNGVLGLESPFLG